MLEHKDASNNQNIQFQLNHSQERKLQSQSQQVLPPLQQSQQLWLKLKKPQLLLPQQKKLTLQLKQLLLKIFLLQRMNLLRKRIRNQILKQNFLKMLLKIHQQVFHQTVMLEKMLKENGITEKAQMKLEHQLKPKFNIKMLMNQEELLHLKQISKQLPKKLLIKFQLTT